MMSKKQAYAAMFEFLKNVYERTENDELGGLLGGMCLLEDGTTADAAAWKDWEIAIQKTVQADDVEKLDLQ